jgi:hypothetical protein
VAKHKRVAITVTRATTRPRWAVPVTEQ